MAETELDILLSRVVDGRATPGDWAALERLGQQDPSVWRDLAMLQRDDRALRAAVALATAPAQAVELNIPRAHTSRALSMRARRVASWAGWAAAAAVALAFVTTKGPPPAAPTGSPITAGLGAPSPVMSAADSLAEYLSKGRAEGTVIQEVPEKWLVGTVPTRDGSAQQVIYLRLIMERTEVPDLYTFSRDEWGNPAPARVPLPAPAPQPEPRRVRPPV
jgi:hypothetical protein